MKNFDGGLIYWNQSPEVNTVHLSCQKNCFKLRDSDIEMDFGEINIPIFLRDAEKSRFLIKYSFI